MKFLLLLLLCTCFLVGHTTASGQKQKQKTGFTSCTTKEDCVGTGKCPESFGFKLGNCYDGLCKCYNTEAEGVEPKDCPEKKSGSCFDACKKASTDYVKDDKAYLCGKQCFCKFHTVNLDRCRNNQDCGRNCTFIEDADEKKKCEDAQTKKKTTDIRCTSGRSTCNDINKACYCEGTESGSVGTLDKTACKDESYCKGLCAAQPFASAGKGQICSRTVNGKTYNNCFCPDKNDN